MNALQPLEPLESPRPRQKPRVRSQPRPRSWASSSSAIAVETTIKLAVNSVICTAAIVGLIKLFPQYLSQQVKLREIRIEVKQAEQKVDLLRTQFSRSFDPQQAKNVMQEQSPKVDPLQKRVVWVDPQYR